METKKANRLDRIDRYQGVNESYKSFTVALKLSSEFGGHYQMQVMAITAISLLCRWCSAINIDFEDRSCIIEKYKGLQLSDVFQLLKEGQDCKVDVNNKSFHGDANFYIGDCTDNKSFWIQCNDWLAGYGHGPAVSSSYSTNTNPLGAAFAACLGVAELFRVANGQHVELFSKWYSLVDFADASKPDGLKNNIPFPTHFDIGKILQVGCGAVGSNFLFFLGLTNWKAEIDLVDYDPVSTENCANSLVFSEDHVDHKKVAVCKNEFHSKSISIQPFEDDYNGYKQNEKRLADPDVVLCFANERNIWEDVQYDLPPLCFHATTNKNWGVNFGRHIPVKEWCLICRFENDLHKKKEIEFGCSAGVIKNENTGEETIGMLPFLSATSALLVLVDVAKLSLHDYPVNYNFLEFSFATRQGMFVNLPNRRKPCYVCKTQALSLYQKFRGNTKYWHLSN